MNKSHETNHTLHTNLREGEPLGEGEREGSESDGAEGGHLVEGGRAVHAEPLDHLDQRGDLGVADGVLDHLVRQGLGRREHPLHVVAPRPLRLAGQEVDLDLDVLVEGGRELVLVAEPGVRVPRVEVLVDLSRERWSA